VEYRPYPAAAMQPWPFWRHVKSLQDSSWAPNTMREDTNTRDLRDERAVTCRMCRLSRIGIPVLVFPNGLPDREHDKNIVKICTTRSRKRWSIRIQQDLGKYAGEPLLLIRKIIIDTSGSCPVLKDAVRMVGLEKRSKILSEFQEHCMKQKENVSKEVFFPSLQPFPCIKRHHFQPPKLIIVSATPERRSPRTEPHRDHARAIVSNHVLAIRQARPLPMSTCEIKRRRFSIRLFKRIILEIKAKCPNARRRLSSHPHSDDSVEARLEPFSNSVFR